MGAAGAGAGVGTGVGPGAAGPGAEGAGAAGAAAAGATGAGAAAVPSNTRAASPNAVSPIRNLQQWNEGVRAMLEEEAASTPLTPPTPLRRTMFPRMTRLYRRLMGRH